MTLIQKSFTGTPGAPITTAADAGAAVRNVGTGASITFDTAYGRTGTGLKFIEVSGQPCILDFPMNAANAQAQVTVEVTTPTSAPASSYVTLFTVRHASGRVLSIGFTSASKFLTVDGANTLTAFQSSGVDVIFAANTRYRISLVLTGASTTTGQITAKVYASGGSTVLGQVALTNANLTANNIAAVRLGDSPGASYTFGFDELQMNDGAGSEIPEYSVVNNPPTVSITGVQNLAANATATLTVSASDTDGTIASYDLDFDYPTSGKPTITGDGTATPSFPVGATTGVLYVPRETVTDNTGATASTTTEVRVPITTNADAKPLPMDSVKVGSWTRVGGSATDGAALNDSSNTTYLESGSVSGTEQKMRIRLQPRAALGSGAQIGVTLASDTGTTNWQIRLYDGATLRQSWSQASVGTTPTEHLFTISDPTLAAITDWGGLWIEAGVTS